MVLWHIAYEYNDANVLYLLDIGSGFNTLNYIFQDIIVFVVEEFI
jgi:hypothetical protein